MRRLWPGAAIGAMVASAISGATLLTTPTPALALANHLETTPTMGWDDWNAFACNNDAADVEANAEFIHTSGLQADGYKYVINDGCWNDLVGVDPNLYPSGTATPAQPDPEGNSISGALPTTTEEAACGVVNGRGTGVPGTSGRSVPDGQLFINPYLFPPSHECANDGMTLVANYVHSLGLKFGLWLDASDDWNGEEIPGSYGFDSEDVTTFASWGVDYIKADWSGNAKPPSNDPLPFGAASFDTQCGTVTGTPPKLTGVMAPCTGTNTLTHEQLAQLMYTALSIAVQSTGRPTVLNLCVHDAQALVQQWGAADGNSWKSDLNLSDTFASLVAMVNDVDQYAQFAGPDGFNDPDMLTVGDGGMTLAEDESQFSLWAEMAAPLIMGANMAPAPEVTQAEQRTGVYQALPAATQAQEQYDLAIFGNKAVIAVDQDPLGKQGTIVSFNGTQLILAKPLADGDTAVTLFNEGTAPALMSTSGAAIGMPGASIYTLDNLWTNQVTETGGAISAFVQPGATVMYRISAPRNFETALADAPSTTLSVSSTSPVINPDAHTPVTVSLTNNGVTPIIVTDASLQAPTGWTVSGGLGDPALLAFAETANINFTVGSGPASVPISSVTLTGQAGFDGTRGHERSAAPLPIPFAPPVESPYSTADSTGGPAAVFGELGSAMGIDAAGTGVSAAGRNPASDQYGAIYLPSGAGTSATAVVQVTAISSGRGPEAGLMVRNSIAGSAPEGVVLYLNGNGQVVMAWDATSGGADVTASETAAGTPGSGIWLQLERTGSDTYTGAYATSDSGPWTTVGSIILPSANAAASQDVGIFASSGAAGSPSLADFNGFAVTS